MGLYTTHNCWHGAYSRFNRFRYSLAKQIGINLDEYIGYHANGTKNLQDIPHDLMPLFDHSDCDGNLDNEDQRKIIIGLNDVLENFKETKEYDEDFKERIEQFRDGCLDAFTKNQVIEFR